MSQTLLPLVCLEDVVSMSWLLLVLFRSDTRFRSASSRAWYKSLHFRVRICLLLPANLPPAMNVRTPTAQYPLYSIRNLPPLKTPALKVFYIMVIPKLPEPVSQSAVGLSNIGPQTVAGVQHVHTQDLPLFFPHCSWSQSLFMYYGNAVEEGEAELLQACCLALLSHDGRWLQLALPVWAERSSAAKSCRERLKGARLATGADVVSSSIKPSFRARWALLLMLWCVKHDSTHSALEASHMESLSSAAFQPGRSYHCLFLSPVCACRWLGRTDVQCCCGMA